MNKIANRAAMIIAVAAVGAPMPVDALIEDITSTSAVATVDAKSIEALPLRCPLDLSLLSQTITTPTSGTVVVRGMQPVNSGGTVIFVDGVYAGPVGANYTFFNSSDSVQRVQVQALCGRPQFGSAAVVGAVNITAKQFGTVRAQCPSGYVATGGGYFGTAVNTLSDYPHFNSGPPLSARSDGLHEAPGGWAADMYNPGDTDQIQFALAYCVNNAGLTLRTNVLSHLATDKLTYVSATARGNDYAVGFGVSNHFAISAQSSASWQPAEAAAPRGFNYTSGPDTFRIGAGGTIGRFVTNTIQSQSRSAMAGPPVDIKLAMVITPSVGPAPAENVVQAVEFYHAASDHYFITAIPKEISDLDNKVHPGWARTGQSFNAYAAGSGGPSDRLPVCRYYGLPQAGLDSHFYTGGVLECLEVGAKFAGAWEIESGEVFQMRFPDVVTGACPAGTTPVMRTWNQRPDSNHRYMTSIAIRDQMKANGSISEGYGPNGVVFCAPA